MVDSTELFGYEMKNINQKVSAQRCQAFMSMCLRLIDCCELMSAFLPTILIRNCHPDFILMSLPLF
jgi:hypothetical protein